MARLRLPIAPHQERVEISRHMNPQRMRFEEASRSSKFQTGGDFRESWTIRLSGTAGLRWGNRNVGGAVTVMEAQGITWPNWHDGEPGEGPIAKLYHVRGYPTVYVLDAEGKICSKRSLGSSLDELVEKLVVDQEAGGD